MVIIHNHIGYERTGQKKAVINAPDNTTLDCFSLKEYGTGRTVYKGKIKRSGIVDNWKGFYFWTLDFSEYTEEGQYYIEVNADGKTFICETFTIEDRIFEQLTLPDIMNYFVSQHCTGRFDRMDRSLSIVGRNERVDVHGGWYDASGDNGKYLSHLSHANYMNPQQTPMVVWNFLAAADLYEGEESSTRKLIYYYLMDEATHGGDFLVRLKDPEGYFYMGVRNEDWKDPEKRSVVGVSGNQKLMQGNGNRKITCQAGYREGAGIAIAALARLSAKTSYGDYASRTYLQTAIDAFDHLQEHNREYLFDGKENILDDYCGLLAATELYIASGEERFYQAAAKRAECLKDRQIKNGSYPGHFRADDSGERPYYHAAEAGLPVIALLRFLDIAKSDPVKKEILDTIKAALEFTLSITHEVVNPFGYARQYVKPVDMPAHGSFFMPHNNETGYWWQGENATIASLSAMALLSVKHFKEDKEFCSRLIGFAIDQLNWILGLNPFDSCMLHGRGHNNKDYFDPLPLVLGGICNGVTGGFEDETDIAFSPDGLKDNPSHSWRWAEQWTPHGAWYALAAAAHSTLV